MVGGASEADQSTITGEPLPAPKPAGDEVFVGTLNGMGALRVRVDRDASESVIAGVRIDGLVAWDLFWQLPLPLGVAGHEGSTVLVGLDGLRLLREAAWCKAAATDF